MYKSFSIIISLISMNFGVVYAGNANSANNNVCGKYNNLNCQHGTAHGTFHSCYYNQHHHNGKLDSICECRCLDHTGKFLGLKHIAYNAPVRNPVSSF